MRVKVQILILLVLSEMCVGQNIDSIKQVAAGLPNESAFELLYATSVEVLMNDFNASYEMGALALERGNKMGSPKDIARAKTAMGTARFYIAKHDEAESLFLQAQHIYDSLGMQTEQANGLGRLGALYMNMSRYDEASDFYKKSIGLCRALGDSLGVARNFLNMGLIFDYTGDEQRAADYYKRSERIGDELGDDKTSSYAKNNFASLQFKQGNFAQARQSYLECIEIGEVMQDNLLLADSYFMLSKTLLELDQLNEARKCAEKSLKIDQAQHNVRGQCMKWALMGEINEADGDIVTAHEDYLRSLEFAEMAEDKDQVLPVSLLNLGRVERLLSELSDSKTHLEEAIASAKRSGVRSFQADALNELAFTLNELGNSEEAFKLLNRGHELRDSLINVTNSEHINRLEAQYENEKKEIEIERLHFENELSAERASRANQVVWASLMLLIFVAFIALILYRSNRFKQKTNSVLEKQNLEKAALLKEIHHRVKNNLQIISSLLNLQSANLVDNQAIDAIKEGQNRVKSIALIHQKLYQTEDIAKVDFQDYCEQLTSFLSSTFMLPDKEVETKVNANGIELDIDTAVPLGLIINELVTNAFKYAFEGRASGQIWITVDRSAANDGQYNLSVRDNGLGIKDGIVVKNSKSLGLKLVHILTRQVKGVLSFRNDGGALFEITFKESKAVKYVE